MEPDETSPSFISRLSPELIDWTIDFLHSDRDALKICSLVCKSWLCSARFHLFRSLHISTQQANTRLRQMTPPSLANVQDLYIGRSVDKRSWIPRQDTWAVTANMPALRSLTIIRTRFSYLSPLAPGTPNAWNKLTRLFISRLYDDGRYYSELIRVICSFPVLAELSLHSCTMKVEPSKKSTGRLPSTLRALDIRSPKKFSTHIVAWIGQHEQLPRITSLCLPVAVPGVPELLNTLRDTLVHLRLMDDVFYNEHNSWHSVDVGDMLILESLYIKSMHRIQSILTPLCQPQSPQLQSLVLDMTITLRDFLSELFIKDCIKLPTNLTAVEVLVLSDQGFTCAINGRWRESEARLRQILGCVNVDWEWVKRSR